MVSPEALYAALRQTGAAAWFDLGHTTVLLALEDDDGASLPLAVGANAWEERARALPAHPAPAWSGAGPVPLARRLLSGTFGWFSYEAGAWFVRTPTPRAALALPAAWLARATAVAVLERGRWQLATREGAVHHAGAWTVASQGSNALSSESNDPTDRLVEAWRSALRHEASELTQGSARVVDATTEAAYLAGVQAIQEHLRAGDCYQVNLARRVTLGSPGSPFDAWRRLRALNRARRGALIETARGAVVSNSPELLLHAERGRALSVPIKGTAARSGGAAARDALRASPKERAELRMIVDLVRADFARVARPGSIRTGPRRVGAVGHVWHAMQRVQCELDAPHDSVDAFRAVFPAGSVTGAPRMRAMEVIHALESVPRGVYCGSIGGFYDVSPGGHVGAAHWNVAIRTLSFTPDGSEAHLHVGAGIVLGSDPAREWEETSLKAERLLQAMT